MTENLSLFSPYEKWEADLNSALALVESGHIEQAIASYKKIIHLDPVFVVAYLQLATVMQLQGRLSEAIELYDQAIAINPHISSSHKRLINLIEAKGEFNDAFKYYELNRVDTKEVELQPEDVLCCLVERNELLRLPYFLEYYRQKGIKKFFVVDNNSDDGSLAYLQEQPDVYLWHSNKSFNQVHFGSAWCELLLRKYGVGHWCLFLDADEIFYYPDCEKKNIIQLCKELDYKQKTAFSAVHLDMYSDKSIKDTRYVSGQNFLDFCSYFDREFYTFKQEECLPHINQTRYFGGVRKRVFGADDDYRYCLVC